MKSKKETTQKVLIFYFYLKIYRSVYSKINDVATLVSALKKSNEFKYSSVTQTFIASEVQILKTGAYLTDCLTA